MNFEKIVALVSVVFVVGFFCYVALHDDFANVDTDKNIYLKPIATDLDPKGKKVTIMRDALHRVTCYSYDSKYISCVNDTDPCR